MISTAIVGGTALLPAGPLDDAVVLVDDGGIETVGPMDVLAVPSGAAVIDASRLLVAPGLIDLQVNGGFGFDLTEDPWSVWALGARLPEHGVTAFLPTLVSAAATTIREAQAALAAGPPTGWRGAMPLGWHLEGPFISPARRGVHPQARLLTPDRVLAAGWRADTGVRLVTVAPELDGAPELITLLTRAGVVVGLGHSAATFEQGRMGIEAGARYATHLFNAMPPLDHRAPGLAGAVLADARVVIGVIPDGVHIHPVVIDTVRRAVGPSRLSVVTDAIAALGTQSSPSTVGGVQVAVDETSVREAGDGRLAGSVLTLDAAVRNLIAYSIGAIEPADALATVTRVPAHLLGEHFRGRIEPGARADLTIFDAGLGVVATIVAGDVLTGPWA